MKPYLSIVVPAYNAVGTIRQLLSSLIGSRGDVSAEVIVVDDASTDKTSDVVYKYWKKHKKRSSSIVSVSVKRLPKNKGPASARNKGAKKAKGEILLFLDSDVTVFPDTLLEVTRSFRDDPDLFALTGVWDKHQRTKKFFPRFKALRDWSYWINERDQRGYYYLFSTRVASVKRDLFLRLGGFDERYTSASVEDIEFTYRIARRYAVVFNPKVRVKHEFEDFRPIARKYFIRSKEWNKLYRKRGKFDPVATTRSEALTAIAAVGFVAMVVMLPFVVLVIQLIREIWGIGEINGMSLSWFLYIWLAGIVVFLFIHIYGVRKFLRFAYREEGLIFAVKSFFMGIVLYIVICAGAVAFLYDI